MRKQIDKSAYDLNMPSFSWMVFEPGSDTRCCYVGSLDEARELINQELSPST